jgi:hypothetical protein
MIVQVAYPTSIQKRYIDKWSVILNRLSISPGVFCSGEMCGLSLFDGSARNQEHGFAISDNTVINTAKRSSPG